MVVEFEGMNEKEKIKVRNSYDWPEIAKYYDKYHDVMQHNIAEHAWRMKIGVEPVGKIEYVNGSFIMPIKD